MNAISTATTRSTSTLTDEEKAAKVAAKRAHDAEVKRAKRAAAKAAEAAATPTVEAEVVQTVSASSLNATSGGVVAEALATHGTEIIGAVTFWSLRGVRMRRDDLRVAMLNLGLGFALPKDPKPQACLRLAVEQVRRAVSERVVFDRVSDSKGEVVFAMSGRSTDEVGEVAQYQHRTRVRLDKATGVLILEDTSDEILQKVAATYAEIRDYLTTMEFGLTLINALRGRRHSPGLSAINLRGDTGGVYFVPAGNVGKLNALAELVDVVAGRGGLTVWPISAGARTVTQAADAAKVDLMARIATTRTDVRDMLASLDADAEIDPSGRRILARAKAFAGLRARAAVFGDILGDVRAEIDAQIGELQAAIEARIGATMGGDFDLAEDESAEDDDTSADS